MRPIELLAPARNLECGIEAIRHGADAVYIGAPRFGARAAAGNSVDDIAALVRFARPFGVRIYVTLNTLLHDDELPAVQALMADLAAVGVSALITQDPRILPPTSASPAPHTPNPAPHTPSPAPPTLLSPLPLHSSTQQDNRTVADVLARQAAGYEQVVLARELSLDDIRAIHAAAPAMPLEAFVHGALCVSYSGRCYASEYCFGRSANRGECAQFCRLPFDLIDETGRTIERQRHLLSLRDMNRAADLEAMMDAGVSSFKIEGRLKDVAYVKNITAYYRQRLDAILQRRGADYCRASFGGSTITFTPDPRKSFNRGFTDYYLHGPRLGTPKDTSPRLGHPNTPEDAPHTTHPVHQHLTPKSLGEPVGRVKDIARRGPASATSTAAAGTSIAVAGTATFANGDGLCFFSPDGRLIGFRVNRVDQQGRLYPADGADLSTLRKGTPLFRNYDAAFSRLLARPTADRRVAVRWTLEDIPAVDVPAADAPANAPADAPADGSSPTAFRLTLTTEAGESVTRTFPYPHEAARTPQADAIRRQLLRLGDTPYTCTEADIDLRLHGDWFIPASVLAEWRREVTAHEDVNAQPLPSLTGGVGGGSLRAGAAGPFPLMTCRYCLRDALGQCLRRKSSLRGALSLRLADGRRFPLHFDCQRCEMHVLAPDEKPQSLRT